MWEKLLLLLSRFSRVRLCATQQTAAHQASPSLGFSRQKYWSGVPFPSPMHESEKWKWSRVWLLVNPWTAAHQAPPSMGFSRQEYRSGVPSPSLAIINTEPNKLGLMNCMNYVINFLKRKSRWWKFHFLLQGVKCLSEVISQYLTQAM